MRKMGEKQGEREDCKSFNLGLASRGLYAAVSCLQKNDRECGMIISGAQNGKIQSH